MIAFTTIQNRTLLSGAHPGSELKVNFHRMANDTLPLVFHTERHGRLICTREEAGAVRVRVLRVVTPKTSRQRRILSKTWGRQCALSESSFGARGWGKTCREAECQKFHTHLETMYVGAIRVKHSHCRAALFTHHGQDCGARMGKNILRGMTRTKRLKDRYFYQQGIPGNTTANAACGQQLTRPARNTTLRLRGASK